LKTLWDEVFTPIQAAGQRSFQTGFASIVSPKNVLQKMADVMEAAHRIGSEQQPLSCMDTWSARRIIEHLFRFKKSPGPDCGFNRSSHGHSNRATQSRKEKFCAGPSRHVRADLQPWPGFSWTTLNICSHPGSRRVRMPVA